MTPCEERGYKIGDRFEVTNGDMLSHGSIVELYNDDGSLNPPFILISGMCKHQWAGGNPGGFLNLDYVQLIGEEMNTKERIEQLEQELAELKKEYAEEWEPEGGEWYIDDFGEVVPGSTGPKTCAFGIERSNRQLAEKARDAMRIHNRALAYVHEHAPDWDGRDSWSVWCSLGEWAAVSDPQPEIGTVIGPRHVMKQLVADLNSGRVKL